MVKNFLFKFYLNKMKKFQSKLLNVQYHGCNIGYKDGTRKLVTKKCSKPTYNPFWKNPEHYNNGVAKSRRAQLKQKPLAFKKDVQKYVQNHIGNHGEAMKILALIVNGSDSDSDTNGSDSDTDYYSVKSLPKTNYRMSNLTGDDLVIDIKPEPDDTQQNSEKTVYEQNPELKLKPELETQNPDNKKQKIPADNAL